MLEPEKDLELANALLRLLGNDLLSPSVQLEYAKRNRGPHLACIMGYQRQYTKVSLDQSPVFGSDFPKVPELTVWHREHLDEVEEFLAHPLIQRIM